MVRFFRKLLSRAYHMVVGFFHRISRACSAKKNLAKARRMLRVTPAQDVVPQKPLQEIFPDVGNLSVVGPLQISSPSCDVSIVIPMYNAAAFILPCLESVVQQKTKYSYEVLLIDDGSTDNTIELVSPYLTRPEFHLIRQENHGQSYARNRAIEQSAGQYLLMLDADDLLLPGAIEILYTEATRQNAEIVGCGRVRFHSVLEPQEPPVDYHVRLYRAADDASFVLTSTGYSTGILFHRDLWVSLRFPERYIFEDVITKFILRRKATRVAEVDAPLYGYRINQASSSHVKLNLKHLDSVWVFPKIVSLCESEGVPFDSVFYLLSLNHITVLNAITVGRMPQEIALAGFCEMQKQLRSLAPYRPRRIPRTFRILERAVLRGSFPAWKLAADTVISNYLLSKWREIN